MRKVVRPFLVGIGAIALVLSVGWAYFLYAPAPEAPRSGTGNCRRFLDCEVRALRRLYDKGSWSMYGIARVMSVSETTVRKILKGTCTAAEAFGLADRGHIAPGARADLVLVEGNPLEDVTATRAIVRVFKNGFDVLR